MCRPATTSGLGDVADVGGALGQTGAGPFGFLTIRRSFHSSSGLAAPSRLHTSSMLTPRLSSSSTLIGQGPTRSPRKQHGPILNAYKTPQLTR